MTLVNCVDFRHGTQAFNYVEFRRSTQAFNELSITFLNMFPNETH